jgi:hypothetical protein
MILSYRVYIKCHCLNITVIIFIEFVYFFSFIKGFVHYSSWDESVHFMSIRFKMAGNQRVGRDSRYRSICCPYYKHYFLVAVL